MNDLYPYLLRNEKTKQFGATLSSIIPKRKEAMNKTKKLVVYFNGEEQDSIEVSDVRLFLGGDFIKLHIDTIEEEKENELPTEEEGAPSSKGVVDPTQAEIFLLSGDELESFEVLSSFRQKENISENRENISPIHHIIETNVYNITDINSVDNAKMDLINAENTLIAQGYKVFKVKTPKFQFNGNIYFKLIENCILCKVENVQQETVDN